MTILTFEYKPDICERNYIVKIMYYMCSSTKSHTTTENMKLAVILPMCHIVR